MNYKKQFRDLLEEIARDTYSQPWQVMENWAELTAIGLSLPEKKPDRWERFLNLTGEGKKYHGMLPQLNSLLEDILVPALEENPEQDFLGEIYCEPWSNKRNGEVFTPYHVAKGIAKMTLFDAKSIIKQQGYITIYEPACGSGVMGIAARNIFIDMGLSPTLKLHITGHDIKRTYCHFTYIQWSLLGMAAEVKLGNSLTGEFSDRWTSPILKLHWGYWNLRLALKAIKANRTEEPKPTDHTIETNQEPPFNPVQLSLF